MRPRLAPLRVKTPDNGFELSRIKVCPQCGQTFTTYQKADNPHPPMEVDPMPRNGFGVRETCGEPECWDLEDQLQFGIRRQWRMETPSQPKGNQPVPLARKLI